MNMSSTERNTRADFGPISNRRLSSTKYWSDIGPSSLFPVDRTRIILHLIAGKIPTETKLFFSSLIIAHVNINKTIFIDVYTGSEMYETSAHAQYWLHHYNMYNVTGPTRQDIALSCHAGSEMASHPNLFTMLSTSLIEAGGHIFMSTLVKEIAYLDILTFFSNNVILI